MSDHLAVLRGMLAAEEARAESAREADSIGLPCDAGAESREAALREAIRAVEDAKRYRWLRDRIHPREINEGYARMHAANIDHGISQMTDMAVDDAIKGNA